jgi:hypothetical protein
VKQVDGMADFGWRRGREHSSGAALMAQWIGHGNRDLAVKMGAVECCDGVGRFL